MNNKVLVILPKWIWKEAANNDEFKANLSRYMNKNYPLYIVVTVKKYEVICAR